MVSIAFQGYEADFYIEEGFVYKSITNVKIVHYHLGQLNYLTLSHYLERCIVIRAKTESVEKMVYSTIRLLSTVCGGHPKIHQ